MSSPVPWNDARTLLLAANLLPADRVHFANEPFSQPNPPALWMSIDAFSPAINLIDVGGDLYDERGMIRVMCIAPAGTGTDDVRALAKSVADVFRDLGPRNPRYINASISQAGGSDDGMWLSLMVSVSFSYQDSTG